MTSSELRLSKDEWRQVSDVAARIDWARYSPTRYNHLEAGFSDRTAAALHQLLRA
jgi:hypothetical protein